jgi:hypothetical protein
MPLTSFSFPEMAAHVHEHLNEIALSAPERERVARIIGPNANYALERVWTRYNCLLELRDLLIRLAPLERSIRAMNTAAAA